MDKTYVGSGIMTRLTLDQASVIIDTTLDTAHKKGFRPLTVVVIDDGGNLKAMKREDGPGAPLRPQIAFGKAFGAVGFGAETSGASASAAGGDLAFALVRPQPWQRTRSA